MSSANIELLFLTAWHTLQIDIIIMPQKKAQGLAESPGRKILIFNFECDADFEMPMEKIKSHFFCFLPY